MKRRPVHVRFFSKVRMTDGCWVWTGALSSNGYGSFWDGRGSARAHRFAYEQVVGPIPAGKELDHLCRNPRCVRPEHLEPVTNEENSRRGIGTRSRHKTHCLRGHPLFGPNVRVTAEGHRECRACWRINARRSDDRRRQGPLVACAKCGRRFRGAQGLRTHRSRMHGGLDECLRGHALTPENRGYRNRCKECHRIREQERRREEIAS